ncbi:LacI family DNA-binding transcriptional regulator [Bifidobacterium sp. ESL0732]|uniref:LacI family DNA-binding transcriptional regulator n=1 Tax=Bifidobacterium sp. ESL0732 TaxID=2983222 RepID=UPI0023F8AF2B|nr:LacI family DNA-binding transcriptional regulator [Bifidobacterium sp. ESL0732]WEV63734.1 LacI family DNA-binding transcriptional regulator [Bifidobacterium sp. ESL0732]
MHVTLTEVAAATNVSVSTASKALNDTGHLSAHTRRLVRKTAQQLGYISPHLRQASHEYRSGLIGLVSGDLEGRFSIPALAGAEDAFGKSNHAVLLTDSRGDPKLERSHIDQMAAHGIDGLLVLGGETDSRPPIKPNTAMDVPIVYAYAPSTDPSDCSITCDNIKAGDRAITHLQQLGRRKIIILSGPDYYQAARDRILGATQAMDRASLKPVIPIWFGSWNESYGRTATAQLIEDHLDFDGIYCLNDMLARGCIDSLLEHGIRVPQDVAVIGHDNWLTTSQACRVPITTFDNNLHELGRKAAHLLLDAIKGHPHQGLSTIDCSLIIRQSAPESRNQHSHAK